MQTSADGIRVLHVDDEPDVAELTATYIERADDRFTVETATSAEEGLTRLADVDVDCVVSDYEMAGQDGLEFLEAVREEYPELPFILYTGKGSEAVASDAISAGVTDYLQKESGTGQYAVLANRIANAVQKYRTQQALETSQRRLDLFFEQSPLGVIRWDENFDAARMNGAAEEILGYAAEEFVGRSWETIVPESDADTVAAVVSDLLGNEGGYHSVNENVREDGEHIICEWHNRVVTDENGSVVAIFSQFQDVTERKTQERRLETLIDNLPGMVYRCRDDPGWPMEDVRGEVEALTGYAPSTVEEREGIYGTEIVHPADRNDVWETVQRALDARDSFDITYRIHTRDGDTRWVWERGRGLYADDGTVEAIEGFVTDVTEREEARRELRAEREFVEQALDALDDVFYVVGTDGSIQRWNSRLSDVTGYTDEEIDELDAVEFFPEAERDRIADAIGETLRTGHMVLESEVLTAGGDRLPYEITGSRLTDDEGDPVGLVGVGRDIADRKRRERALERQNRRLDEFVGVVSHDLRNPLNVAGGRIRLARDDCESEHLAHAATAIERSQALVDDLLVLAREGEDLDETAPVPLADVAEEAWRSVHTAAATLTVDANGTVEADRSRLQQLLENLFRNAVEHSGDGVGVMVGATDGGFYVADDGPGLPAATREKVGDDPPASIETGAGFGLVIVERIAQAHGWELVVGESEHGGARFEMLTNAGRTAES